MIDDTLHKKINLLIQLACSDGDFDVKERAFIYNVSLRHGIPLDTIGDLIESTTPITSMTDLSLDTKVDYLTECVLLVFVDGKVLPKEINFCVTLGAQLGFSQSMIEELINNSRKLPVINYDGVKELIHTLANSAIKA